MIFIIYGDNFQKRNIQKNKIIETLKVKRPESIFHSLDEERFDESFLKSSISSFGLFDEKSIFEIKGSFLKKENERLFQEYLDDLEGSENAFVFVEEKISVKTKNLINKKNIKNYCFEKEQKVKGDINLFILTDLFLLKDKKSLWTKYQEFISLGKSEEEIFGILFWAIKSLSIVSKSTDINETNMKPFVYNKNKRILSKWTDKEIDDKMIEMIDIYHNTRRGLVDFKAELERLVLS